MPFSLARVHTGGIGQCDWGREWGGDEQMEVASDWAGLSLGGFWVSAGVSVGKERMKDER